MEDHDNFSTKIEEKDVYKVYAQMAKTFKDDVSGFVDNGPIENTKVYENKKVNFYLFVRFYFKFILVLRFNKKKIFNFRIYSFTICIDCYNYSIFFSFIRK